MARDRRPRDDDDFDDDQPRRAPRRRPRDDDDFDDEPARPPRRATKPDNTVKVLAVVGGVLLGIAVVCSGAAFLVYRSVARGVSDAQQKAQQDMTKMAVEQQKVMNQEMAKAGDAMQQRQVDRVNSDKAKATAAAEAFLQEVNGGRAGAAYRMLSADYRRRTTEAEFAKLLAAGSAGRGSSFPVKADLFAPDSGTTYTFEVWAGSQTVKLTAIKENGAWAIDAFTVTGK